MRERREQARVEKGYALYEDDLNKLRITQPVLQTSRPQQYLSSGVMRSSRTGSSV